MKLCRLQGIHMNYGRESVLRGVDLDINRGAILGLVGENGSGKSTLLKILAGVLRPDSGTLLAAERRPRIGYMPESSQWYPYLTGAQVLRYFARYTGATSQAQEQTLELVGLWPMRDKKVSAYSKGMRQKLGLAQAILGSPDLIVLDEPTNGLDPPAIIDFYKTLQARADEGVAVVLSSHLLAEIEGRTTHVAFLRDGCIAASGGCAELIEAAGLLSRVLLRGARSPDQLRASLEQFNNNLGKSGWHTESREDGVEVTLPRHEVARLLASLETEAAEHLDIQVHHPSLDDLYLHTLVPEREPAKPVSTNGQVKTGHREVGMQSPQGR